MSKMVATFEVVFDTDIMCDKDTLNDEYGGSWFKVMSYLYEENGLGIFNEEFELKGVSPVTTSQTPLPPDPLGDFFESQGIKVVDCTPSPSKCTHFHCDLPDGHPPLSNPTQSQADELRCTNGLEHHGRNHAIDEFEQNLLKALEEV